MEMTASYCSLCKELYSNLHAALHRDDSWQGQLLSAYSAG